MSEVREILKKRPLLFDGGMGTYYKAKPGQECEQANLLDPEGVLAVHGAYLEAGADAIKTNTFGLPRMAAAGNPLWEALTDEGWRAGRTGRCKDRRCRVRRSWPGPGYGIAPGGTDLYGPCRAVCRIGCKELFV